RLHAERRGERAERVLFPREGPLARVGVDDGPAFDDEALHELGLPGAAPADDQARHAVVDVALERLELRLPADEDPRHQLARAPAVAVGAAGRQLGKGPMVMPRLSSSRWKRSDARASLSRPGSAPCATAARMRRSRASSGLQKFFWKKLPSVSSSSRPSS